MFVETNLYLMDEAYEALETLDASLTEVRRNLTYLIALFLVALVVFFMFAVDPLLLYIKNHVLTQVADQVEVIQWTPTEFLIYKVKVSAVLALLAISPIIGVLIFRGVKKNIDIDVELNLSFKGRFLVLIVALALFFAGLFYSFFLMLPIMMKFLVMLTPQEFAFTPRLSSFYNFVALLSLAFGVVFELPLIMNLLVRSGIVSYETLSKRRKEAYVGIVIIGAAFTPPDIVSQAIMATPLIIFYEIGLLILRFTSAPSKEKIPT